MRDKTSTGILTSLLRSGCPDTARYPQVLARQIAKIAGWEQWHEISRID